jgi:membrane protein
MPNRHVPARHAWVGGLVAALLFELVKHLFVAYVERVPTYSLVYGAFASAPIFLVWMFCCWMVVLIGAELTATLSYFRHAEEHLRRAPREKAAASIVDALAAAGVPIDFHAVRTRAPMPIDQAEDLLDALVESGLVLESNGKGPKRYRLGIAREEIDLARLRAALEAAV